MLCDIQDIVLFWNYFEIRQIGKERTNVDSNGVQSTRLSREKAAIQSC